MERILVGLDGSDRSKDVLDVAVALARKVGGKLVLFRGVGIPVEVPQAAYSMSPTEVADLLQKEAKDYLDRLAATIPAELGAETRVAFGTPWKSVCGAASELRVDLIVIGSHGYGGIDRVLGTTAAKIVNHATTSVLVVRSHALAE